MYVYIYVLVGSVTCAEVNEHVEEILSLCGEAPSGKESLALLRCVRMYVCVHVYVHVAMTVVCVCVCHCDSVCVAGSCLTTKGFIGNLPATGREWVINK